MSPDPPSTNTMERLLATLACLDLELESELALYRRLHAQTASSLTPYIETEPELDLELKSEPTSDVLEGMGADALDAASLPSEPTDTDMPQDTVLVLASEDADTGRIEGIIDPEMSSDVASLGGGEDGAEPELAGELVPFAALEDEEPETLPEPYGADMTAEPEAFERFLDPSIGDYLESSEALLKHLETSSEATEQKVQQLTRKSWIKALKIIMGLLGVGVAIAVGVVLAHQWFLSKPRQPVSVPQDSVQP
ncbi:MAG: hypothetical protein WCD18_14950, partial [Thermosynechococcaceae cyanobacterium]